MFHRTLPPRVTTAGRPEAAGAASAARRHAAGRPASSGLQGWFPPQGGTVVLLIFKSEKLVQALVLLDPGAPAPLSCVAVFGAERVGPFGTRPAQAGPEMVHVSWPGANGPTQLQRPSRMWHQPVLVQLCARTPRASTSICSAFDQLARTRVPGVLLVSPCAM